LQTWFQLVRAVLPPVFAAVMLLPQGSSVAQSGPPKTGMSVKRPSSPETPEEQGAIRPSGLQAVFPALARCPEIASPYGSPTRYDGSARPSSEFGGRHGGIDLTLAVGTPLLAVAAGTVVAKGSGGMLEGNYIWLRHAPEDTGLPYWVYSKYQHLSAVPELPLETKVAVGQVIAQSGATGTAGRHYGMNGYPHLHLTTRKSSRGDEPVGGRGTTGAAGLFDPLVVYKEAGSLRESLGSLADANAVMISYAVTDGKVVPVGTRVVWPVACEPR
jgi:murein DD-endopeptidase MepM/ murein hydrolase activator NlpD